MASEGQQPRSGPLRRGAVWLGLAVLSVAVTVVFFPPINQMWQKLTCLWSEELRCDPSATVFKADRKGFCSLGDVGDLVGSAREVGDIATRPTPGEEMASRARLCADFTDERMRPAIDHLAHLAERFDTCFDFDDHALSDGSSGQVTNRFEVDSGSAAVCTVPIAWINGKRSLIKRSDPGVVLCLPGTTLGTGPIQETTNLRFCSAEQLQSIGVNKAWVDQITAIVGSS